jgi:AcrR family transcriptional regulator
VSKDPSARPRKRHEEVVRAAAELFYERGYDATTTRDITERLGLLKGSLYYYIDTKEDLLFAAMQSALEGGLFSFKVALEGGGSPLDRLGRVIKNHIIFLSQNLLETTLVLHEARSLTDARREVILAEEDAYRRGIRELIEAGKAEGLVRPDVDPQMVTMCVLGAINWVYRWYSESGGTSPEEIGQQFADVLVAGISAPEPVRRSRGSAKVADPQRQKRRTSK